MHTIVKNSPARLRFMAVITAAILGLTILPSIAHATCYDHGRSVKRTLFSGFDAKMAAAPNAANHSIVGLWHVTYTTSDNQPFQESFDMWHNDGTELEIANVDPIAGNSCIGVWRQAGAEIHLHHVGWGFDSVGNLIGAFTVDDVITLGAFGNSYSGSFDFKQYDINSNLLQEVTGTITATRIGVN